MSAATRRWIVVYIVLLGASLVVLPVTGLLNRFLDTEQNRERWKPCRAELDILVGSPWQLVREKCGAWSKSVTATTTRGHLIRLYYGGYFEGGPFFSVLIVDGIVDGITDYPER
jgi:hypothetical protein